MDWLDRIRAGNPPTNRAESNRHTRARDRKKDVEDANGNGISIILENMNAFSAITDPRQKWNKMKAVVQEVLQTLYKVCQSMPCYQHVMYEIVPSSVAPYYLIGIPEEKVPRNKNGEIVPFEDFDALTQWPDGVERAIELTVPKAQFQEWIRAAVALVDRELVSVLQPDPLKVIHDALDDTNRARVSPLQSLQTIRDFLDQNRPRLPRYRNFGGIYNETIRTLNEIEEQILMIVIPAPNTPPGNPMDALKRIFDSAKLDYGSIVLRGRAELAIRLALTELFATSSIEDQNTAAQFLAADDILQVLQTTSGKNDTASLLEDLGESLLVTQGTLQDFTNVFGKDIKKVLKKYAEMEETQSGTSAARYRHDRAKLCLKLPAVPVWPKKVPQELCSGLQLQPLFRGGPKSILIDAKEFDRPHEERACHYRDYLRQSKIYDRSNGEAAKS